MGVGVSKEKALRAADDDDTKGDARKWHKELRNLKGKCIEYMAREKGNKNADDWIYWPSPSVVKKGETPENKPCKEFWDGVQAWVNQIFSGSKHTVKGTTKSARLYPLAVLWNHILDPEDKKNLENEDVQDRLKGLHPELEILFEKVNYIKGKKESSEAWDAVMKIVKEEAVLEDLESTDQQLAIIADTREGVKMEREDLSQKLVERRRKALATKHEGESLKDDPTKTITDKFKEISELRRTTESLGGGGKKRRKSSKKRRRTKKRRKSSKKKRKYSKRKRKSYRRKY